MALEPGEAVGIVNLMVDQMQPTVDGLESRLTAVEHRVANIEPHIRGMVGGQMTAVDGDEGVDAGRVAELEAAVAEIVGAVTELRQVYGQIAEVIVSHGVAIARVLAGEGDRDAWLAYVARETVAGGVGVREYATLVKQMRGTGQGADAADGAQVADGEGE